MYALTYIQIRQYVLLSYVFNVFFFKKIPHECCDHVTLTLTVSFICENPIHIRVLYLHTTIYKNSSMETMGNPYIYM